MAELKYEVDEVILRSLRVLCVGQMVKAGKRRKARRCLAVEFDYAGEFEDESQILFSFEDGTAASVSMFGAFSVFEKE
jgi:hypothetical protein